MMDCVNGTERLRETLHKHSDFLVLAFHGEFSASSRRAMKELRDFSRENEQIPVYVVDVEKVRGAHKEFGVKNVPTVLALENGRATRFIEGVQSARFYAVALAGAAPASLAPHREKRPRRVVVYTGPACPWCARVKTHLREHGVPFQEVNVAQDPRAAEKLVRRSGHMGVPQTDIDGRLVVGFDQAKLNRLLGIQAERR